MKKPEIGVVFPTFNSAKMLEWTLLALKSQEGCRVKIIVVDSGSSNETREICTRHKVHSEYDPPGNMYRAINMGMRLLEIRSGLHILTRETLFIEIITAVL